MRKKIGYIAAAIMTAAVLAGCGKNNEVKPTTAPTEAVNTPELTATPVPTEAPTPTATPAPTATPTVKVTPTLVPSREVVKNPFAYDEMRGLTPKELVAEMTVGWNLGNTMDATNGSGIGSETSWGNPKTSPEMIETIAAYGFDLLRIPTTWSNHIIDDKYTIDPDWMARVKEIVDYAFENGMYVILNTHHEESWQKPDYEHLDAVKAEQAALWKQIAEYFKDYGDHLVFEGMNEPRVQGSENEWNGGTPEGRDCINQLNQNFVDTVRATGGNNSTRLLLITTYAAASSAGAYAGYVFPEDANIGLSLHAYTPYKFTYDSKGESWNTAEYKPAIQNEINSVMNEMVRFSQKGDVPVIITECGSVTKKLNGELNFEEVGKWAQGYMDAAKKRHMPCIFWDNGAFKSTGENFGLLNRKTLTWYYPDVINAVTAVYYTETEEE